MGLGEKIAAGAAAGVFGVGVGVLGGCTNESDPQPPQPPADTGGAAECVIQTEVEPLEGGQEARNVGERCVAVIGGNGVSIGRIAAGDVFPVDCIDVSDATLTVPWGGTTGRVGVSGPVAGVADC